jgi:hypothetical protein
MNEVRGLSRDGSPLVLIRTNAPLLLWCHGAQASNMRISGEALDEFVEIYREESGEDISRDEASEMAIRILTLYTLLSKKPSGLDGSGRATTHAEAQVVHQT